MGTLDDHYTSTSSPFSWSKSTIDGVAFLSSLVCDEDRLVVSTVRASEGAGDLSEMQKDCSWFLCIRNAMFENFIG